MTELSELKSVWRESAAESIIGDCGKEEIRMVLQGRSADVKKQILKRITAEIKIYLWTGLFLLCALALGGFSSGRALVLGAALLVFISSLGALAYKEYRLRTLPMAGTLRESVSALIDAVDSTERLYVYAYVAAIAVSLALIGFLLLSRKGWDLVTAGFVVGALAFVCWSYVSGRGYASRMFQSYRADLVSALEELERL